jgi:hypothetical protein
MPAARYRCNALAMAAGVGEGGGGDPLGGCTGAPAQDGSRASYKTLGLTVASAFDAAMTLPA